MSCVSIDPPDNKINKKLTKIPIWIQKLLFIPDGFCQNEMHMYMWTQPQFSSNYLKHFCWQDQVVSIYSKVFLFYICVSLCL